MSTVFNHSVIRAPKWTGLPLPPDLLSRTLLPDICQMAGLFYSLSFSFHASCSKKGSISDIGCKGTCCLYFKGLFRIQNRVCHSQHYGPFGPHKSFSWGIVLCIVGAYQHPDLYSLPTPWLPFPSGQSRMTQHIASSPLGGKSHLWLGNNLRLLSCLRAERSWFGMQGFYYFST